MTPVALPFGRGTVTLEVLPGARVLRADAAPAFADAAREVTRALTEPLGTRPLRELADGKASAVVALSDFTRPVPHKVILPPLLDEIARAGIPRDRTVLLFANGLHRPMSETEIVASVGSQVARDYRVINHRAADTESLAHLGTAQAGIPLWISRHFLDADLRILTGLVEPHLMAGFSGGCKVAAPGVAGEETIKALHSPQLLEDPRCREGELEDNPLQSVIRAIGQEVGVDFLLNVSLNEERRIAGVFAGHPTKAHDAGVAFCREWQQIECEEADVVVTTSGGWPLDATLYQAVKGVTAALPAVRSGGTLFLVAECSEGLGSLAFREELATIEDATEYLHRITHRTEVKIDQWQLEELCRALRKARVIVHSPRLREEYAGRLFSFATDLSREVDEALARAGPGAKLTVIPQGPYVLLREKAAGE